MALCGGAKAGSLVVAVSGIPSLSGWHGTCLMVGVLLCERMQPSVLFVVLVHGRELDDFVNVDEDIDRLDGEMEHECADEANRHGYEPHGNGIAAQTEFGIAAGREDAGDGGHIHGFADNVVGTDDKHRAQVITGGIGECAEQLDKGNDGENDQAGEDTADEGDMAELFAVSFCGIEMTLSQLRADQDTAGTGDTGTDTDHEVFDDIGNGVGSGGITAHMAENDAVHGKAQAPDELIAEHREGIFPVFPMAICVNVQDMRQTDFDAIGLAHDEQNEDEFDEFGEHGCNRRTGNAELRESCQTENQQRIHHEIDQHGNQADDGTLCSHAAVFHDDKIHLREAEQQVGEGNGTEILCAIGDEYGVGGKTAHEPFGANHRPERKGYGYENAPAQPDAEELFDDIGTANAPILCSENRNAGHQCKQE